MQLELSENQREELARLVSAALSDLSSEIAATENPAYVDLLRDRRVHLVSILAQLVATP